jgi:hypothetical protein
LLVALFIFAAPAQARSAVGRAQPVQTITVVDHANVRPWVLQRVEAAIFAQINGPVHRAWHTPIVRFGPGGSERVFLGYGLDGLCPSDGDSCHVPGPGTISVTGSSSCDCTITTYAGEVAPFAVVATSGDGWFDGLSPTWSVYMDHEILEMLEDPMLGGDEICDPVASDLYQTDDGAMLSDWVLPKFFQAGTRGPFDYLRELHSQAQAEED